MKKVLFLLLLASVMPAFAQVDTLWWRQREPTFYYWGTHWADCHARYTVEHPYAIASIIVARRCIADSTLKVIGVAAPASIYIPAHSTIDSSRIANRVPEYFQLYEATIDSFYLVDEVRYDNTQPRYRMEMPDPFHGGNTPRDPGYHDFEEVPYVYEAYFGRPHIVSDSFYVAVTNYNSDWYFDESNKQYTQGQRYATLYYEIQGVPSGDTTCDLYKLRYTNPFDQVQENELPSRLLDYRDEYSRGWIYDNPRNPEWPRALGFKPIFPIFDTTGLDIHGFQWVGECDTVQNVQLLDVNNGVVYLSWNSGQHARWWEVSYGPVGTRPEDGMRDTVQHSFIRLEGLQQDSEYVVYVRERCREDTRGVWSEGLQVLVVNTSDVKAPQKSDVDIHTHLIPNPASGPVTVISGFRIEAIEVYTVAGTLVETIGLKANTGVIDTSRWPKGAYILRVRTSHGDTAKRLVVQ